MTVYYEDRSVTLHHGDCLDVLKELPDNSVDSVCTDPPYGLEFMGKEWDAPWKSSDTSVHAAARSLRGDEMLDENKRRYIASAVNKFQAGKPFQAWCQTWSEQCLRVLKPGGHLLAFGGTRTSHRLACAIEDAGFEIRDSIAWLYGSGFPKNLDVGKAIDRARDDKADIHKVCAFVVAYRELAGSSNRDIDQHFGFNGMAGHWTDTRSQQATVPTVAQWGRLKVILSMPDYMDDEVWRLNGRKGTPGEAWETAEVLRTEDRMNEASGVVNVGQGPRTAVTRQIKAANTDAARQWQGWGTAMKPAHEPIVCARKPLVGTVAGNVQAFGVGALNIASCRIHGDDSPAGRLRHGGGSAHSGSMSGGALNPDIRPESPAGRWPANVVLDEDQAAALDQMSGNLTSGSRTAGTYGLMGYQGADAAPMPAIEGDTGGASRYFYTAKASSDERPGVDGTRHPTVKPLSLMRFLVRLVTPPGGVILDPFGGTGTTALVAKALGRTGISVDMSFDYCRLATWRTNDRNQLAHILDLERIPAGNPAQLDLFGEIVEPPLKSGGGGLAYAKRNGRDCSECGYPSQYSRTSCEKCGAVREVSA